MLSSTDFLKALSMASCGTDKALRVSVQSACSAEINLSNIMLMLTSSTSALQHQDVDVDRRIAPSGGAVTDLGVSREGRHAARVPNHGQNGLQEGAQAAEQTRGEIPTQY